MRYANGQYNRAQGTRDAFGRWAAALVAEGHPDPLSISGDREHAEQVQIFVDRYDQQSSGSGPFGDVRWWDGTADGYPGGTRWVRYSPAGTVAVPGSGNHEARRSNDLAWPYNDASTAAHRRGRELAPDYGITCEGMNFGEMWHWTFWWALGVIGSPASSDSRPFPESTTYHLEDPMSRPLAYVKGDKAAAVYAVYVDAGANNAAAATQGGVYCARRYVSAGELAIAQKNGFELQTIPQADLDAIPKVYGSK